MIYVLLIFIALTVARMAAKRLQPTVDWRPQGEFSPYAILVGLALLALMANRYWLHLF
jgi:hypothetical protein